MDTGADLNVYLETGEDGEKGGCCPKPLGGNASAPATSGSGCCAPASTPAGTESEAVAAEKTDLDEFVGKWDAWIPTWAETGLSIGLVNPFSQDRTRSLLSRTKIVGESQRP